MFEQQLLIDYVATFANLNSEIEKQLSEAQITKMDNIANKI